MTIGKIDLDELSKTIARSSTVARGDVFAVFIALIDEAVQSLANGNQISFGKLGSLTLDLKVTALKQRINLHNHLLKAQR